jgi:serine/threonine-protein kinase
VQTAATDSLVGRSLEGRYRILEPIARGGMSTVYAAVDERLDRLVAVKVMSSVLSADPAFTDRFAREARAAARLTHLNVVSVYDQGQDSGHEAGADGHHVFLVMELVEGRTLRELLRERGRLGPAEAVSLMEPVLSALSAAHRAGLVHRDVKPENILLSDDGVVKVADFGLARAVEADPAATRTGLMMGTVAYCAPEQISEGRADPRSDVYAAGVVLFELLTGTPPYRGESAMNVAYQHVHSRVPAPSSKVKGIPSELDEIVVAATDSDPTGRPADAGAFLAEIAALRSALGLPVVPVPPRERTAARGLRHEPRNRTPDSATTATDMLHGRPSQNDTTVVPRGAAGARPKQLLTRDDNAPPPPVVIPPPKNKKQLSQRTRRRRRGLLVLLIVVLLGVGAGYAGWWFASGRYSHVPELVGVQQADAISKVKAAGYDYKIVQPGSGAYSNTVAKGLVLRTKPNANSRWPRGRTVTIYLSAGPRYYTLPPVRGKSPDDALATLRGIGSLQITPTVTPEASLTVPAGRVTRTDPKAGTQVTSKQTITVYVSTGPPIIGVPQIAQNTPFEEAKGTLRHAGFKVAEVDEFNDSIAKGNVITLHPADRAPKGSTITVTVSKGPQFVQIPTFGQLEPLSDVKSTLVSLGLHVVVDKAFGGHSGLVVGVAPSSGTTVAVGSTVTVTVV